MVDKSTILQIFGTLMKHPQFLSESDKYNLTPDDFFYRFDKFIFVAIDSLYRDGAERINPIDIENYLSNNAAASTLFKSNKGIEYLQDADYLSDIQSFPYYYKKLKKFNLLSSLKDQGIDVSEFYIEDLTNPRACDVNEKFEDLEINDILDTIKKRVLGVERNYIQNDTTETENVFTGIEDVIEDAKSQNDVGLPLQGDIFNEIAAGARKGALYIRSGGSGVSKTRQAVGDACYLAFPMRYDQTAGRWVQEGCNQKILFIATEQNFKEIQKMILAYLTGFNETKFRYGEFSDAEQLVLKQALKVLETYQDNFFIVRMPNPTIELVKTIVRENVLTHDIEYVFYDYIFIGPSLLNEFKGFNLRNDEVLLMFATALKDLAVELNVFVMTSTQVNAKADDNSNIRNESSLAGSRSIINKADLGVIMARPTKEELEVFNNDASIGPAYVPNIVTDVYKVRSGEWNQVRIWSDVNLGNLRKKDLFVTNSRMELIDSIGLEYRYIMNWSEGDEFEIAEVLKEVNGME